ncbi:MAG: DUF3035 domain-containing protein [Hyphomonadaceae bacterium]
MKTALMLSAALVAAAAVSGCGGVRRAIGVEKVAPDEFRIITKAPLVLPPDYSLRPPRPGEPRPAELSGPIAARAQVFGQDVGSKASEGEKLLVAKAGAAAVDPTIRSQVDFEGAAIVRKSETFSNNVLDYGKSGAAAPTLDQQEATRKVTGDGAVTIERGDSKKSKLPGL